MPAREVGGGLLEGAWGGGVSLTPAVVAFEVVRILKLPIPAVAEFPPSSARCVREHALRWKHPPQALGSRSIGGGLAGALEVPQLPPGTKPSASALRAASSDAASPACAATASGARGSERYSSNPAEGLAPYLALSRFM